MGIGSRTKDQPATRTIWEEPYYREVAQVQALWGTPLPQRKGKGFKEWRKEGSNEGKKQQRVEDSVLRSMMVSLWRLGAFADVLPRDGNLPTITEHGMMGKGPVLCKQCGRGNKNRQARLVQIGKLSQATVLGLGESGQRGGPNLAPPHPEVLGNRRSG